MKIFEIKKNFDHKLIFVNIKTILFNESVSTNCVRHIKQEIEHHFISGIMRNPTVFDFKNPLIFSKAQL